MAETQMDMLIENFLNNHTGYRDRLLSFNWGPVSNGGGSATNSPWSKSNRDKNFVVVRRSDEYSNRFLTLAASGIKIPRAKIFFYTRNENTVLIKFRMEFKGLMVSTFIVGVESEVATNTVSWSFEEFKFVE